MSIRTQLVPILACFTAALALKADADLPNLITGIEVNCTEEGQRLHTDWTGKCTMPRMDVDLFFLAHDLGHSAQRDLAGFLKLSEREPLAQGLAEMIMDKLQFLDLRPARHSSEKDPDPDWIFALPTASDVFCQFGYVPEADWDATDSTWEDWRRFRCYVGLRDVYLVADFTPKAWQYPTSYFVSLIHVLLTR